MAPAQDHNDRRIVGERGRKRVYIRYIGTTGGPHRPINKNENLPSSWWNLRDRRRHNYKVKRSARARPSNEKSTDNLPGAPFLFYFIFFAFSQTPSIFFSMQNTESTIPRAYPSASCVWEVLDKPDQRGVLYTSKCKPEGKRVGCHANSHW